MFSKGGDLKLPTCTTLLPMSVGQDCLRIKFWGQQGRLLRESMWHRNSKLAKEMLENIKKACCVSGNYDFVAKQEDVRETLELLSERLGLPTGDPLLGLPFWWHHTFFGSDTIHRPRATCADCNPPPTFHACFLLFLTFLLCSAALLSRKWLKTSQINRQHRIR